jgi:hypothetical protein
MVNFDHIKSKTFRIILEGVHTAVCNTDTWEFFKNTNLKNFIDTYVKEVYNIFWEVEKLDIDCTLDELEEAFQHIKKIAVLGWDNYLLSI